HTGRTGRRAGGGAESARRLRTGAERGRAFARGDGRLVEQHRAVLVLDIQLAADRGRRVTRRLRLAAVGDAVGAFGHRVETVGAGVLAERERARTERR